MRAMAFFIVVKTLSFNLLFITPSYLRPRLQTVCDGLGSSLPQVCIADFQFRASANSFQASALSQRGIETKALIGSQTLD